MARVRKTPVTLDWLCFSTPEQKVMKLLISEPTTVFNFRSISSKLKGVRGLGGGEGILKILLELEELGFVDFLDNQRAVRLRDGNAVVKMLKKFVSVCDLENLTRILEPITQRGILFGLRALGESNSESEYELCVVVNDAEKEALVRQTVSGHPLGKLVLLTVVLADDFDSIEKKNPSLAKRLVGSIVLWANSGW